MLPPVDEKISGFAPFGALQMLSLAEAENLHFTSIMEWM